MVETSQAKAFFDNIEAALKQVDALIERTNNPELKQMLLKKRIPLEAKLQKNRKRFGLPKVPAND